MGSLRGGASREGKEALRALMESDPDGFRAKVRACRVEKGSNPDYQQRRAAVSQFIKSLVQKVGVLHYCEVEWFLQNKFVDKLVSDGMTVADAAAKWEAEYTRTGKQ